MRSSSLYYADQNRGSQWSWEPLTSIKLQKGFREVGKRVRVKMEDGMREKEHGQEGKTCIRRVAKAWVRVNHLIQ